MSYYDNFNPTLLDLVSPEAKRICEFGCGGGGMAIAVKKRFSDVYYAGIELMEEPFSRALEVLDDGLLRNLDQMKNWDEDPAMASLLPHESFDHIIFGDVLEHLYDPEATLKQAVSRLKFGGSVLACIPNVQHWSVIAQLILGSWPRQESGIFDRTHIRWFTLDDMVDMFHQSGLKVTQVVPRIFDADKGADVMEYLEPLAAHLGVNEAKMIERGLPLQYVLKGVRIQPPPK